MDHTPAPGHRGRHARRRRCAAAALAVTVRCTLSACGGHARFRPVHKVVEPTDKSQQSAMAYNPQAPRPGASAQEVVEGFLAAGVGAQGPLTRSPASTSRRSWRPRGSRTPGC
ncbi:hypothetical protein QJS66_22645 [Kocuria rhizophila]|nr:hypothetical protein QJS66_22645 [Kocuria rhizophila]